MENEIKIDRQISYAPLLKLLKKKKMKKSRLIDIAGVHRDVIRHISKNEPLTMNMLLRICSALNCKLSDVVEFIKLQD
ncbi:MAG: helix-turn-helix transcriptional regulator [Anaerolineaceae bacterium]|nr:helix-turn-helix transcriptional regulator [Anaerolineaceae bacterium]